MPAAPPAPAPVTQEDEEEEEKGSSDTGGSGKKKRSRKKKKSKESEQALGPIDEGQVDVSVPLAGDEEWVDISDVCDLAMKGMGVGEMIEAPTFRLFDAMSAIEIMDPKMDSGYNNSADMTLERAQSTGIIAESLSHAELIAIWDELLMYYLMWLEGHTIVQTCFCCLYLQDLERFARPIPLLGVFLDAFLLVCRAARNAVLFANVFDDEDFLPSMFGIDLEACVFSKEKMWVYAGLQKELKALAKNKSPEAKAVSCRLEFIGAYMLALTDIGDTAPREGVRDYDSAKRRLTASLGLVERLGEGTQPPEPEALRCFDASINRALLVPGPPRTVQPIRDHKVVLEMWTSHIQELLLCCELMQVPLTQVLDCAITYKGEPNVLARSVAHLCTSEEGHLRKLMLDSLEMYLFPKDAQQHCKKSVDTFLAHSETLFHLLLKLAHANRARRFRRLAHVFSDFNSLQHYAWQLDEELRQTFGTNLRHPRPCWVWIMEHCLNAMITKLFLGFSLELYDAAEFHMIYWYIDYLYGLRIYNLNEMYHTKEQTAANSKKKSAARQDKAAALRGGNRPRNPPACLLLFEATQAAVRGLFRLLAFCLRVGLLAAPGAAVEGLAQRFVLRFRTLENFRLPHLPSFRDFERSSEAAQASFVLDAAQSSFGEAAQILEKLGTSKEQADTRMTDNAKALKRVVVANQLAVTQLLRSCEGGKLSEKGPRVTAAPTHHPHLVSVRVVPAG